MRLSPPDCVRHAGLPIYMANTDYGDYQAWAEGSLIAVERVLAFHLAVAAPSVRAAPEVLIIAQPIPACYYKHYYKMQVQNVCQ